MFVLIIANICSHEKRFLLKPYSHLKLKGHKLELPVNMALSADLRRGEGAKWSKLDLKAGYFLVNEQLIPVKGELTITFSFHSTFPREPFPSRLTNPFL